jgi:hypothetical protein
MSVWADKLDDVRFSLNDFYMILLMSGWMILFMGLLHGEKIPVFAGAVLTLAAFGAIRSQLFVTQDQYLRGMIPHHSMAVHTSRKLLQKGTTLRPFVQSIVETQEKEIEYMKGQI